MAVRIRLARYGAKKKPFYRIVVADKESPRDGRFLEVLGTYNPLVKTNPCEIKKDRVEYWISKGAKSTETVSSLLKSALASTPS